MGYPGAIMFLFFVGGFFLYLLPLFILGVSAFKCFSYVYPSYRATTFKGFWVPILSGVLTAACGFFYAVCGGFGSGERAVNSSMIIIFIIIVWILPLVLFIAWAILAVKAKRSQLSESGKQQAMQ
jgi:hypothetical protein